MVWSSLDVHPLLQTVVEFGQRASNDMEAQNSTPTVYNRASLEVSSLSLPKVETELPDNVSSGKYM